MKPTGRFATGIIFLGVLLGAFACRSESVAVCTEVARPTVTLPEAYRPDECTAGANQCLQLNLCAEGLCPPGVKPAAAKEWLPYCDWLLLCDCEFTDEELAGIWFGGEQGNEDAGSVGSDAGQSNIEPDNSEDASANLTDTGVSSVDADHSNGSGTSQSGKADAGAGAAVDAGLGEAEIHALFQTRSRAVLASDDVVVSATEPDEDGQYTLIFSAEEGIGDEPDTSGSVEYVAKGDSFVFAPMRPQGLGKAIAVGRIGRLLRLESSIDWSSTVDDVLTRLAGLCSSGGPGEGFLYRVLGFAPPSRPSKATSLECATGPSPRTGEPIEDCSLGQRDDMPGVTEFCNCLASEQTIGGCMAIEVSYLVNAVCQDSCPWFQVRNHDYEVPGPTLSGMADDHGTCASPGRCAKLCDATSSCCNRDFIRDTFLYGDLTNQAPSPIEPAFGPVTLSPQTIILDGTLANEKLEVQTFYEANALLIESGTTLVGAGVGLGTGNPILAIRLKLTLDLLLEYLTRTRNPVTTFQSPDEADGDCAYNVTLPYHGFEGQVKQCIREFPGDGVYSNIRGTGLETRLAGLNEFQGRRKFQALLYETRGKIDRVLAEAEAAGLCCTGATLHGGTVEWQEGQPKLVLDTTATENPPFALSIGEFGVVTTEGDIARSLTIDTGQTFEIAFRVDKSACSTLSLFRVEPYFAATADAPVDSLDRIGTGFNCGGAIDAAGFCGANVEQVRSPTVSRSNVTSVYPEAGTTSGVYEGYLVLTACDADDPLGGPPECARSSFPISVVVN